MLSSSTLAKSNAPSSSPPLPTSKDLAYLRQHNLPPIIDALLQDVLLVQPPNPYVWMANQLRDLREGGGGGSAAKGSSAPAVVDASRTTTLRDGAKVIAL